MDTLFLCPSCGKPLATNAPKGLCPACLLKAAFQTGTEHNPGATTPEFVPPKPEDLAPHFPQLEILECLGRGGMGVVYKARQKTLNRFVALKLLAPEKVQEAQFASRFLREAQALARLNHPNIVTVHDFGETGGLYFLLMEYMDGPNLRQLLRSRKVPPAEALAIVPRICEALQYAHDQGVVHRDIKPENILLDTQGRVKIADFGIAKLLGAEAQGNFTNEEQIIGTPHYMAPEQTEKPREVDHRADIYSLGVVFYEMLTGELPLGKFQAPSQKVEIDVRLDDVVLRALEKEPERRFQTARVLQTRVENIASSAPAPEHASARLYAPEQPPSDRVNWIPALVLASIACITWMTLDLIAFGNNGGADVFLTLLALPFWLTNTAVWAYLHYKCWSALPPRYRSVSPGRAIGFLFIPFFNLYWAFISFPQLAEGFNRLRKDHPALPLKDLKNISIGYAIVFVCSWTIALKTGVATFVAIADILLFILYYQGIVHNANMVIASARGENVEQPATWSASAVGALVMTVVSLPVGGGALVWLGGILLEESWHPSSSEMRFTIALFAAGLLAVAACVTLGIIALARARRSTTPYLGHWAGTTAVAIWPCLLVVAAITWFGYSQITAGQKALAWQEAREAEAKQREAIAKLTGSTNGVLVGRVVERRINAIQSGEGEEALTLKTAWLHSFGDADLTQDAAYDGWCRSNKVDLMMSLDGKRWSLVTLKQGGAKFSDFPNDKWETTNVFEVTEALTKVSQLPHSVSGAMLTITLPKKASLPQTFAFRTPEGSEGLIQFTGLSQDPAFVDLRYKILKPAPEADRSAPKQ